MISLWSSLWTYRSCAITRNDQPVRPGSPGGSGEALTQDDELLAAFSDEKNDFLLFIAWHDYRALTGAMPFEAQVLYSWVEALYPEKMSTRRDFSHIPMLTGMTAIDRRSQKVRLKMTVEMVSGMPDILEHEETEKRTLVFSE